MKYKHQHPCSFLTPTCTHIDDQRYQVLYVIAFYHTLTYNSKHLYELYGTEGEESSQTHEP